MIEIINNIMTKKCKKCNKVQPIKVFKHHGSKGYLGSTCKECYLIYQRAYRKKHRERIKAYNKKYRDKQRPPKISEKEEQEAARNRFGKIYNSNVIMQAHGNKLYTVINKIISGEINYIGVARRITQ